MFQSDYAPVRYGTGRHQEFSLPQRADDILAPLQTRDEMAARFPFPRYLEQAQADRGLLPLERRFNIARRSKNTALEAELKAEIDAYRQTWRDIPLRGLQTTLARMVEDPNGLRERLTLFWQDHFTVRARRSRTQHLVSPFVEEAIRPHVAGSFPAMLKQVSLHPMMLEYLDQLVSVGPNSIIGMRKGSGLNENLAREILELHTLGVDGSYTQTDVREFAELLTGINLNRDDLEPIYHPGKAEPGPETVLGKLYPERGSLEVIEQALDDLALHPETARHLSRKLLVHFCGPTADAECEARMAQRYLATRGNLLATYEVMLTHPSAFAQPLQKVRQPIDYIAAAFRAHGLRGEEIMALDLPSVERHIRTPMAEMGHNWQRPAGPDGLPEQSAEWVSTVQLATRIKWAMAMEETFKLPAKPANAFLETALGPLAPANVRQAILQAANDQQAASLVLASAPFNRR